MDYLKRHKKTYMELEGFLFSLFKKVAFIESASSTKIFDRNAIADVLLVYYETVWILFQFQNILSSNSLVIH